jgi:hypothetical protein
MSDFQGFARGIPDSAAGIAVVYAKASTQHIDRLTGKTCQTISACRHEA